MHWERIPGHQCTLDSLHPRPCSTGFSSRNEHLHQGSLPSGWKDFPFQYLMLLSLVARYYSTPNKVGARPGHHHHPRPPLSQSRSNIFEPVHNTLLFGAIWYSRNPAFPRVVVPSSCAQSPTWALLLAVLRWAPNKHDQCSPVTLPADLSQGTNGQLLPTIRASHRAQLPTWKQGRTSAFAIALLHTVPSLSSCILYSLIAPSC